LNRFTPPPPAIEVHAGEGADDFEMAKFFGADVHQQVFAIRIFAIQPLYRILHRGREFAVRAPNCSRSMLPKRGSGSSTRTVNISFFACEGLGRERKYRFERQAACFVPA
jgi:hypothetical protein